jgi:hypothetical protein
MDGCGWLWVAIWVVAMSGGYEWWLWVIMGGYGMTMGGTMSTVSTMSTVRTMSTMSVVSTVGYVAYSEYSVQ